MNSAVGAYVLSSVILLFTFKQLCAMHVESGMTSCCLLPSRRIGSTMRSVTVMDLGYRDDSCKAACKEG